MFAAFIGLIVGILVMVASAGSAAAEVRASSAEAPGVLEFTYNEPAVRAPQGVGETGAGVTIGGSDPVSSIGTVRVVGVIYDFARSHVAPHTTPLIGPKGEPGATGLFIKAQK